ncbi:MAG: hypothetical protein WBV96_16585 [Polyangia bacterium]
MTTTTTGTGTTTTTPTGTGTTSTTSTGTGNTTTTLTGTGTATTTRKGTGTQSTTLTGTETATTTPTGTETATATPTGTRTKTTTPTGTGTTTTTPTGTGTGTATNPDAGPDAAPDASPDTSPVETGVLTINPSALNFGNNGFVGCTATPTAAAALTLTLSNTGNQAFDWSASLGRAPSPFSFAPASGSLTASGTSGASVTVTVTPIAIPFPADTTANAYGDVLNITTTIPTDVVHVIKLNQTAQGAILAFQPSTPYSFGNVPVGSSSSTSIQVVNSGNASVNVTLTAAKLTGQADAGFTVNSGASAQLNGVVAGAPQTVNIGFAPGGVAADAMPATGTLTMSVGVSAVLCSALPGALQLSGTGTVASVTTNPSSQVVFTGPGMTQNGTVFGAPPQGFTYCGTTAAQQTISFGNTGTTGYTVSAATLGQGVNSPYIVTIGNNGDGVGVVNPNKSILLTLTSTLVPANWNFQTPTMTFTDTLTVTTNAVGDSPHTFSIVQSPYGAVLQNFAPPAAGSIVAFSFANTAGGGQSSIPMGIANAGNAPATVTFAVTTSGNAPTGTWSFDTATLAGFSSLPDGITAFSAYFNAPVVLTRTTYSGGKANFTLTNTPLCATTLPVASATMKGTATTAEPITVTPTSIVFSAIPCGATAPAGVSSTMTIKNATGADAGWTASIPANAINGTIFTLGASSGTVSANSTATFTISPAPIPTDLSVIAPASGDEYSNTLTVTVGASNTFTIPVAELASGLFLELPPSLTSNDPTAGNTFSSQNFLLRNWGDIGANVTLTLTNPSVALLSLNTVAQSPGANPITSYINKTGSGGRVGVTDYVINTSATGVTGSASVAATVPGGTAVCWPLPTMTVTAQ